MNTFAGMGLFLLSAVLVYLAWLLLVRLGTKRRSLDRVFTEPACYGTGRAGLRPDEGMVRAPCRAPAAHG